jgi:hypothetical protein
MKRILNVTVLTLTAFVLLGTISVITQMQPATQLAPTSAVPARQPILA